MNSIKHELYLVMYRKGWWSHRFYDPNCPACKHQLLYDGTPMPDPKPIGGKPEEKRK